MPLSGSSATTSRLHILLTVEFVLELDDAATMLSGAAVMASSVALLTDWEWSSIGHPATDLAWESTSSALHALISTDTECH
jgi:hypothetical protein